MLPLEEGDTAKAHPAHNAAVRTVFVVGPDKKIKLQLQLSHDHRPQLRRDPPRARLHAAYRQAQGSNPGQLEAGWEDVIITGAVTKRGRREDLPRPTRPSKPYLRTTHNRNNRTTSQRKPGDPSG